MVFLMEYIQQKVMMVYILSPKLSPKTAILQKESKNT